MGQPESRCLAHHVGSPRGMPVQLPLPQAIEQAQECALLRQNMASPIMILA